MKKHTPKERNEADAKAELRRKAEAYLQQNPSRGPAVFQLPEQLAIVDPDSVHYPHFTFR